MTTDFNEILKNYGDYYLTYTPGLGWTVSLIGGDISMLITTAEAELFITTADAE